MTKDNEDIGKDQGPGAGAPKSFEEILADHHLWLESQGKDGKQANLSGWDLSGKNLVERDLREANLSGANLQGADLSRANLEKADLTAANLRNAKLLEANFQETNVFKTDFRDADLQEAKLAQSKNKGGMNQRTRFRFRSRARAKSASSTAKARNDQTLDLGPSRKRDAIPHSAVTRTTAGTEARVLSLANHPTAKANTATTPAIPSTTASRPPRA